MMIIATLIATGALLYGSAVAYMYTQQDSIIFPQTINKITLSQAESYKVASLTMADGVTLNGIYLPDSTDPNAPLLLTFGGNAHDVTGFAHFLKHKVYINRPVQVAGFSYRGYPNALNIPSEGTPSQKTSYNDALEIYDQMTATHRPRAVHVIGYSLGTAVATHLATQRPIASLTLVTPFTAMVDLAKTNYPWLPVRALIKHPLPVTEPLATLTSPVSLFHAANDAVIPPEHASKVAAHVQNLKQNHTLITTHADILNEPEIRPLLRNAW